MDDCFPRGLSKTIPHQSCASPPPQTRGPGVQAPSLHSCSLQVGRSQGPTLTLAGLRVPCQAGRVWLSVPQLFACATFSGNHAQRDHSGPRHLCLIHPLLLSPVLLAQDGGKPKSHGLRIPPTSAGASGDLFPILTRIHLVLRVGQREFGDLGLCDAMDCGWRMCSYLFCVLSL